MPNRLQQALDDALLPLFGPNLEKAYQENERHDQELRAIPVRLEAEHDHLAAQAMLEGLEGYELTERLRELRLQYVNRIREAMLAEHAQHRKNIEALQIAPPEGEA